MRRYLLDLQLSFTQPVGKAGSTTGWLWGRTGQSKTQGNPGLPSTGLSSSKTSCLDLASSSPGPLQNYVPCLSSISEHMLLPSVSFSPPLALEVNSSVFSILPHSQAGRQGLAGFCSISHISRCSQSQTAGAGCLPCGEPLAGSLQAFPGLRAFRLSWGNAGSPLGLPCAELQGAPRVPGVPEL